jgi:hypothetical protein
MAKNGELPHFLRVTQTLALVSGLVAGPAAALEACGGSVEGGSGIDAGTTSYDGSPTGTAPSHDYDGGPLGRVYDGGPIGTGPVPVDAGIVAYDGGPTGTVAIDSGYDGGPVGDSVDAGQD